MPDRHKHHPITLRLPEGDRTWVEEHAAATGRPVRAILAEALAEYRARHEAETGELAEGWRWCNDPRYL